MKVLVVCEDHIHDQYVVKPIIERLFEHLGRKAQVSVHTERLRGIEELLREIAAIAQDNRSVGLIVVAVDRDCDRSHKIADRLAFCETRDPRIIAIAAEEEIEIRMLALHPNWRADDWQAMRRDCDVKDNYALAFLAELGDTGPGQGRKAAMRNLGQQWSRLLQLCPELRRLGERIEHRLRPA